MVSVILVILVMVVQSCLQFAPAVFLMFHHYAFGKNSKKKANDLCSYFILGIELVVAILLIAAIWAVQQIREKNFFDEKWFLGIMTGIFVIDAILMIFYFKKNNGTKLNFVLNGRGNTRDKIQNINNNLGALKLGIKSACGELFFTLPMVILLANEVCYVNFNGNLILAIVLVFGYIISAMLPIYKIKFNYKMGKNLAEIQRKRVKNKTIIKFVLGISFAMLTILIIIFRIIHG